MNKQPLLVGVTGGIGAGKSVVCQVLRHLGVPIYDADSRAKMIMIEHKELVNEIKNNFGEDSYLDDGQLNRRYLSERVFKDDKQLKKLNALVHPRVGEDFAAWTTMHDSSPYVVKEAALLIESGSYKHLDKLIVVMASRATRVNRVLLRDIFRSKEEIETIIDKQLSDSAFRKHADYVINNDSDQPILMEILELHKRLEALGSQGG